MELVRQKQKKKELGCIAPSAEASPSSLRQDCLSYEKLAVLFFPQISGLTCGFTHQRRQLQIKPVDAVNSKLMRRLCGGFFITELPVGWTLVYIL